MIELILTLFLLVTEYPIASGMVLLIIAFLIAGLILWYGDKCYEDGWDDGREAMRGEVSMPVWKTLPSTGHELDRPERNKNDGTDWP